MVDRIHAKKTRINKYMIVVLCVVVLLWLIVAILPFGIRLGLGTFYSHTSLSKFIPPTSAGIYGDMFGIYTSLYSGLTLVGVAWAILLQREEVEILKEGARRE